MGPIFCARLDGWNMGILVRGRAYLVVHGDCQLLGGALTNVYSLWFGLLSRTSAQVHAVSSSIAGW